MPNANQALAARASAQGRKLPGDVGRGEVNPADHPGDEAMARGQPEKIPCLADIGPHLDHDSGLHLMRGQFRQEVLRRVFAPQRRELAGHPGVFAPARIPQMMMRVDREPGDRNRHEGTRCAVVEQPGRPQVVP